MAVAVAVVVAVVAVALVTVVVALPVVALAVAVADVAFAVALYVVMLIVIFSSLLTPLQETLLLSFVVVVAVHICRHADCCV